MSFRETLLIDLITYGMCQMYRCQVMLKALSNALKLKLFVDPLKARWPSIPDQRGQIGKGDMSEKGYKLLI